MSKKRTYAQDSAENGTSGNTSSQAVDLSTGLVDIEGTNDNEAGVRGEVTDGDRNALDNVFVDGVDVVLELSRDGDNGGRVGNGSLDELQDALVMFLCGRLLDQIDLVLQDDDVLQLHNLNSGQMFTGLGLRAGFVGGNQQQSGVHDSGTVQHGSHKNIVSYW